MKLNVKINSVLARQMTMNMKFYSRCTKPNGKIYSRKKSWK